MSFFMDGINSLKQVSIDGGGNEKGTVKDIAEKLLFDIDNKKEVNEGALTTEYAELIAALNEAKSHELKNELKAELEETKHEILKAKGKEDIEAAINNLDLSEAGSAEAQALLSEFMNAKNMDDADAIIANIERLAFEEGVGNDTELKYTLDSARLEIGYNAEISELYQRLSEADSLDKEWIQAEIKALEHDYKIEKETIELKHAYESKIDELSSSLGVNISEEVKAELSGLIDDLKNANSKDEVAQIFAEIEAFGYESGIAEDPSFSYNINNAKVDIAYTTEIAELYDKLANTDSNEERARLNAEIKEMELSYNREKIEIDIKYRMEKLEQELGNRDKDIELPEFHGFG